MNRKHLQSIYAVKIMYILLFLALGVNCGVALGAQAEEEAVKQQQENASSNSVLAALGLSAGTGTATSSFMGMSTTSLTIKANNKSNYTISFPTWPLSGNGFINIGIASSSSLIASSISSSSLIAFAGVPSSLITSISPSSFGISEEGGTYIPSTVPIDINVGATTGTAGIVHTVVSASDSSIVGQVLGVVTVTVIP